MLGPYKYSDGQSFIILVHAKPFIVGYAAVAGCTLKAAEYPSYTLDEIDLNRVAYNMTDADREKFPLSGKIDLKIGT